MRNAGAVRARLPRGDGCLLAFGGREGGQHRHGLVAGGREEVAGIEHRGDHGDNGDMEPKDSASESSAAVQETAEPSRRRRSRL